MVYDCAHVCQAWEMLLCRMDRGEYFCFTRYSFVDTLLTAVGSAPYRPLVSCISHHCRYILGAPVGEENLYLLLVPNSSPKSGFNLHFHAIFRELRSHINARGMISLSSLFASKYFPSGGMSHQPCHFMSIPPLTNTRARGRRCCQAQILPSATYSISSSLPLSAPAPACPGSYPNVALVLLPN